MGSKRIGPACSQTLWESKIKLFVEEEHKAYFARTSNNPQGEKLTSSRSLARPYTCIGPRLSPAGWSEKGSDPKYTRVLRSHYPISCRLSQPRQVTPIGVTWITVCAGVIWAPPPRESSIGTLLRQPRISNHRLVCTCALASPQVKWRYSDNWNTNYSYSSKIVLLVDEPDEVQKD